jgi:hypothetical protein
MGAELRRAPVLRRRREFARENNAPDWVDQDLRGVPDAAAVARALALPGLFPAGSRALVFSVPGPPRAPSPLPSRTEWTRLVPPPVLTGHVSSLPTY